MLISKMIGNFNSFFNKSEKTYFDKIPAEIREIVFGHVDPSSLVSLAEAYPHLRDEALSERRWRRYYPNKPGQLIPAKFRAKVIDPSVARYQYLTLSHSLGGPTIAGDWKDYFDVRPNNVFCIYQGIFFGIAFAARKLLAPHLAHYEIVCYLSGIEPFIFDNLPRYRKGNILEKRCATIDLGERLNELLLMEEEYDYTPISSTVVWTRERLGKIDKPYRYKNKLIHWLALNGPVNFPANSISTAVPKRPHNILGRIAIDRDASDIFKILLERGQNIGIEDLRQVLNCSNKTLLTLIHSTQESSLKSLCSGLEARDWSRLLLGVEHMRSFDVNDPDVDPNQWYVLLHKFLLFKPGSVGDGEAEALVSRTEWKDAILKLVRSVSLPDLSRMTTEKNVRLNSVQIEEIVYRKGLDAGWVNSKRERIRKEEPRFNQITRSYWERLHNNLLAWMANYDSVDSFQHQNGLPNASMYEMLEENIPTNVWQWPFDTF